jgi:hypothetical protein
MSYMVFGFHIPESDSAVGGAADAAASGAGVMAVSPATTIVSAVFAESVLHAAAKIAVSARAIPVFILFLHLSDDSFVIGVIRR